MCGTDRVNAVVPKLTPKQREALANGRLRGAVLPSRRAKELAVARHHPCSGP